MCQRTGEWFSLRRPSGSWKPANQPSLVRDDSMFFCWSNPASVDASKEDTLYLWSGLRETDKFPEIRHHFLSKRPANVRERVKGSMEITTEGGIGKYLGLSEYFGFKKQDIFVNIMDRLRQKAHSWTLLDVKVSVWSGKHIMLKFVLLAMSCYAMSCFKLPASLCKQIRSILTRFWWDANPQKKRKMCWVAWSSLALP